MIGWILLILAVAVIVIVLKLQMVSFKHKTSIIFLAVVLLLFISTFMMVSNANSVNLSSASGLFSGFKLYFLWIGHAFDNIHVLTGNAVRMNWFGNATG